MAFSEAKWTVDQIKKAMKYGVVPTFCRGMYATPDNINYCVNIKFIDPEDTYIDGQLISSWKHTVVVRKVGSYPESIEDGVVVIDNYIRNQYKTTPYVDQHIAVEDLSTFKYAAFPVSDTGAVSAAERNRFKARTLFGYRVSKTISHPADRVEYIEDNADFTPAFMDYENDVFNYGDWSNAFFMPRPCMLKYDGTVDYYLDPNDYSKKENGMVSDYNNEAYQGNAMMEWPKIWTKDYTDGYYHYTLISDIKADEDFHCYSNHDRNGNEIDHFYTRIYEGSLLSSKVRSLSGKSVMNSQTGTNEITYARNNGTVWDTGVYVDRLLINKLLVLMGKSKNTQAVFGKGHTDGGTSASSLYVTGKMDQKGLFWGDQTNNVGVKVFGIENWWGNAWERVRGLINANGTQKIKLTYGKEDGSTVNDYNTDGTGYITIANATPGGTDGGYISEVVSTPYGEIAKTASGSETTWDCDGLWFNNSQNNYALVGGLCNDGAHCGALAVAVDSAVSASPWAFGASLSCKPNR